MSFTKTTEQASHYQALEEMSVSDILSNINREDQTVPLAVERALPQIEKLVTRVVEQLKKGGRLFYIGAGTSGRLGIVDASECPPTYGVPHDLVNGIIAGGDQASAGGGQLGASEHRPVHGGPRERGPHDRLRRMDRRLSKGALLLSHE